MQNTEEEVSTKAKVIYYVSYISVTASCIIAVLSMSGFFAK